MIDFYFYLAFVIFATFFFICGYTVGFKHGVRKGLSVWQVVKHSPMLFLETLRPHKHISRGDRLRL